MAAKTIRNIIFDLGGVILNIDPQLTVEAFRNLGWCDFYDPYKQPQGNELFCSFEKGKLSPDEFRDKVRQMINYQIDDIDIDKAWTAMLLDFPAERIRYLEEIKTIYRIFLLSNTNEIHRNKFHMDFEADFGYSFYELFGRNFYSHEMGMRKPDPQIYLQVLNEAGLYANETLFIDDMEENTRTASTTGMNVLHIRQGTLLERLSGYLSDYQVL
jgi:FMN phosphatase YigB (HAD superfamily)